MNHRFSCRCSLIKMGAVGRKCFLAISGTEARSERRRALGFHRKEPAPLGNAQKRLFYFHVYHLEADALIKPHTEPPHKTTNSRRTTHSAAAPHREKLSCRFSSDRLLWVFLRFLSARRAAAPSDSVDTLFPPRESLKMVKRHKKGSELEEETGRGHAGTFICSTASDHRGKPEARLKGTAVY